MFLMRNKVGNIFKRVSTVSKKEQLESLGYKVLSGEAAVKEPEPKKVGDTDGEVVTAPQSADGEVVTAPQSADGEGVTTPQSADGEGVTTPQSADGETEKALEERLKEMKVDELRKYAEENGIDLSKAKAKKEIISVILSFATAEPKAVE